MKWQLLATVVALCATAAMAQVKTGAQQRQSSQPVAPPDSGRECECRGVIRRSLDCSNRERSSFKSDELCTGRTTKIDLSRNNFVTFPTSWGSYITYVNVSHNKLTALPRMPPLNEGTSKLDLSYNLISVASDEFRSLGSLEKLYINNNRLQNLNFLPSPCVLEFINASNNALSSVGDRLTHCTELEDLDLSNNQIVSLPRVALVGLAKLDELRLRDAGLNSIEEGAFHDLVKLELLDLTMNELTSLPAGLFSTLHELDDLFLDYNNLITLPADTFVGLVELERLSITNNKLTNLAQGAFSGLNDLKHLSLNHNKLTSLPTNIFAGLPQIKDIDLSNNQLESLPAHLFTGLGSLQKVYLRENRLSSISADLFSGVVALENADFSHNQLSSLPSGLFRDLSAITILDLSHNRFTTFSGRDLSGLQTVRHLDMEHNLLTALPLYDSSWPQVVKAVFGHNNIVSAGEVTLRSWLGDGTQRVVTIEGRPPLASASSLRWMVTDEQLSTSVSDHMGCGCGSVKKGDAEVRFCVAVACPNVHPTWVEAVRAAPAPAPATSVKG